MMTSDTRCNCDGCRRKLALSDFPCGKCKIRFCLHHRLPEIHNCTHDFKKEGKDLLTKQLVPAIAKKVDVI